LTNEDFELPCTFCGKKFQLLLSPVVEQYGEGWHKEIEACVANNTSVLDQHEGVVDHGELMHVLHCLAKAFGKGYFSKSFMATHPGDYGWHVDADFAENLIDQFSLKIEQYLPHIQQFETPPHRKLKD
jgi:hypothetical protein